MGVPEGGVAKHFAGLQDPGFHKDFIPWQQVDLHVAGFFAVSLNVQLAGFTVDQCGAVTGAAGAQQIGEGVVGTRAADLQLETMTGRDGTVVNRQLTVLCASIQCAEQQHKKGERLDHGVRLSGACDPGSVRRGAGIPKRWRQCALVVSVEVIGNQQGGDD